MSGFQNKVLNLMSRLLGFFRIQKIIYNHREMIKLELDLLKKFKEWNQCMSDKLDDCSNMENKIKKYVNKFRPKTIFCKNFGSLIAIFHEFQIKTDLNLSSSFGHP